MKLLLHACCAPCSIQYVAALVEEGIRPDIFWYNPNIHPYTEYRSRRDSLRAFTREAGLSLAEKDEYGLRLFIKGAEGIKAVAEIAAAAECAEDAAGTKDTESSEGSRNLPGAPSPGRCAFCYRLRLEEAARFAAEKSYDAFSTTLLISPYQNHELLRQSGEKLAALYGLRFLYRDFRPRFREGQKEAREAGYYMQKYCGCIYSEEERYLGGKRT